MMHPIKLFFVLLVCSFGGLVLLNSGRMEVKAQNLEENIEEQKGELEKIRKELEAKRVKIKNLSKKESSVFVEIKNLEEEIELIDKLVVRLNSKSKEVKREILAEEKSLTYSQSRLRDKRMELGSRLRDIYKYMRFREYEILIGASSPLDLMRRLKFIKLITQQDQTLIQEISKDIDNVEKTKKDLELKRIELSSLIKEKDKEEKKREQEKRKKKKRLESIRTEKEAHLKSVKELEKSAKELEELLTTLEEKRSGEEESVSGELFQVLKGRLEWPIKGKIILGFGEQKEPQFNTNVFNPGIDIEPGSVTEVKAVAEGKVVYSSWLRGYGNFVIIQHYGGYYTVYANLNEVLIGVGQGISSSQIIGRIDGSKNGLHFEIRKGKKQLDPLEWLR
ncbi:MAG: peptidoglycan DD-metalloendopeptidase family protein [candidate division Zixibacteria bacterium]|nr:peptidoglycan DD-metalloendopeptidase family protein [candidate division Zixibacteria bacterium]